MKKTLTTLLAVFCLVFTTVVSVGAFTLEHVETASEPDGAAAGAVLAAGSTVYVDATGVFEGIPAGSAVDVGTTEAVYDAAAGTLTGAGYAGTAEFTADGVTTAVVFCAPDKWKPGLNLLTGSEAPFDMEAAEAVALTFCTDKTGTVRGSIEPAVFPADGENHALKMTNSAGGAVTVYTKKDFAAIDKARPVQISFQYSRSAAYPFYMPVNGTTNKLYKDISGLQSAANPTKLDWKSIGAGMPTAASCPAAFTSLSIQAQHSNAPAPKEAVTYLDDLEYIPYYRVAYHLPDGTEQCEYLLYQPGTTKRYTEYTVKTDNYPTADGKVCRGWSTQPDAASPVSVVPLAYADVELYPVWEETRLIDTVTAYVNANGSVKVTKLSDAALTFGFDAGDTEASFDEETLTVTGAGYAGTAVLTASAGEAVEKKTIVFCGATKWKPGLNLLTGSEAGFDMESEEAIDLTFTTYTSNTNTVRGSIEQSLFPKDGTNHALKLTSSADAGTPAVTVHTKNAFAAIDSSRPIALSFRYSRNANYPFYTLVNSTSNVQYKDAAGLVTNASALTLKTIGSELPVKAGCASVITRLAIQAQHASVTDSVTYLDDVAYTPYYKITYIGFDGKTVAATDYALYDAAGIPLDTYVIPDGMVPGATGYYLDAACETERVTQVPLEHRDITLYAAGKRVVYYRSDGVETAVSLPVSEYVIPLPSEVSEAYADTDFIAWTDADGAVYHAGDKLTADEVLAKLNGAALTAFCQDASQPAMGYAFEGDRPVRAADPAFRYQENMDDSGARVLHLRQFGAVSGYKNDNRVYEYGDTCFDPKEYSLFVYRYKVNGVAKVNSTAGDYTAVDPKTDITAVAENIPLRIYFYVNSTPAGYIAGGVHGVETTGVISSSNTYSLYEKDMSSSADWQNAAGVYGFALDPARSNFASDVYMDYIRVYRKGVSTVTYDTNAPEGYEELVLCEVAPETGRGVGKGYLLTGEQPMVETLAFMGWATTPDAGKADVVNAVDLTGDITVYAVWEECLGASDPEKRFGIRCDENAGVRFRASISADAKAFVEEYGFLVTRQALLDELKDVPAVKKELTFEFRRPGTQTPLYAYGAAYRKGEKDIEYAVDAQGNTTFTAVCTGIPADAARETLVARTYVRYVTGSGTEVTVYGGEVSCSLYDVALSVREAGGDDYLNNKAFIDSILAEP